MTDNMCAPQAAVVVEKLDGYISYLVRKDAIGYSEVGQTANETIYFISKLMHINDMLTNNWFNFDFIKEASSLLEYDKQKQTPFVCHLLCVTRSYLADECCDIEKLRSSVYKSLKFSTEQSKGAPIIDNTVLMYRSMPEEELQSLMESNMFLVLMSILLNFHNTSVMEISELLTKQ